MKQVHAQPVVTTNSNMMSRRTSAPSAISITGSTLPPGLLTVLPVSSVEIWPVSIVSRLATCMRHQYYNKQLFFCLYAMAWYAQYRSIPLYSIMINATLLTVFLSTINNPMHLSLIS